MLRSTDSRKLNNAGFSLVELIIVVSILAIAAVPLMKSMGMASKTNAKAQSIQNATSLGEKIMEEMKSTPYDTLKTYPDWTVTDGGSNLVLKKSGITATQGEQFDVEVKIDKATYSGGVTPVADKKENVKSANTLKIPKIEEIDTLSQAVLSSAKELNKYDIEAQNYFNQKIADYPTHTATIMSKTIDIVKKDVTYPTGVTVKATVTYTDNATPTPNKYVKELYTGSFVPIQKDGSTEYKPLDSNIYIFYTKGCISETINITDNSAYTNPLDATSKDSHRVYFIRQVKTDTDGPTVHLSDGTDTFTLQYSNVSALDDDGTAPCGKIKLITNLDKNSIADEGHIYMEEAKTRVYEITVDLYKGSEHITKLNSTISASDPT